MARRKKPHTEEQKQQVRGIGKATRFGQPDGNAYNPYGNPYKSHEVRYAIKAICASEIDLSNPKALDGVVDSLRRKLKRKHPQVALALAATLVSKGLRGDADCIERIINHNEGKLTENVNLSATNTNFNANTTLTDKQRDAALEELLAFAEKCKT